MTLMRRLRGALPALLLALLLAPAASAPAAAATGPWQANEQGRLRLIAASEAAGEADTLQLGLHFQLEPGWKIYWRSPGDAGYPPQVDWGGSQNLSTAELMWPVPHRFELFGLQTFGYGDEVVLPVRAQVREPGAPVHLRAKVEYLTCAEICVPREETLELALPAGPADASRQAFLVNQFMTRVPGQGAEAGLGLERAVLTRTGERPVLSVAVRSAFALDSPDVIVEGPRGFRFGKPETSLRADAKQAVLRVPVERGAQADGPLAGTRLTLTVFDGKRGLEREVVARPGSLGEAGGGLIPGLGRGAPPAGPLALAGMLGIALLGGLILNLMPCVLPVLSLKLLSVVGHGGGERRRVRAGFLASAAGIVFSFLVLAGVAVALKAAGMAVGWGIQFQQPAFLVAMTLVITLFAANLFGLFEVHLPQRLAALAGSGHGHGLGGHFATGVFATLLATPCSAPFLGTAVGFALARGVVEIGLIFLALGIGLALPYLLVAALPQLATRLPRPGPWMVTLRRILGLALVATAGWLVSVLAAEGGLTAALVVGALMLAVLAVLWLRSYVEPAWRRAVPALVLVLAVAAFAAPPTLRTAHTPAAPPRTAGAWQSLDTGRIETLVADGRVVFVDVTADWCITCQVNKSLVIDTETVQRELGRDGVVTMRGDWTRPDERISDYLASFGRYGIPFNAVYGPGAPQGIALPELLTKQTVLEALERARDGAGRTADDGAAGGSTTDSG